MLTPTLEPTVQILNKESEIVDQITELEESMKIPTLNTQFDLGWNILAGRQIRFLKSLLE